MSPINPLDAPLPPLSEEQPESKKKTICTPRQAKLFGKGLFVIWPVNSTLLAYIIGANGNMTWIGQLEWSVTLQLGLLAVVVFFVAIASLFTMEYRHIPYWTRFWQWLLLFKLSVQIALGLLLFVLVCIYTF